MRLEQKHRLRAYVRHVDVSITILLTTRFYENSEDDFSGIDVLQTRSLYYVF